MIKNSTFDRMGARPTNQGMNEYVDYNRDIKYLTVCSTLVAESVIRWISDDECR